MMDIIYIQGLKVETTIGAYTWERQIKQTVLLDIEFSYDFAKAVHQDLVEQAVDYAKVAAKLTEFISQSNFQLIETLAERAAQFLLDEFAISWVKIKLAKPGVIPNAKEVGVRVERTRA